MNKKEIFQNLLTKYNKNAIMPQDVREMTRLLREHPELFDLIDAQINDEWAKQFISEVDDSTEVSKLISTISSFYQNTIWRVAAGVVLLIAAGFVWWFMSSTGNVHYHTDFAERQNIELPDGSEVTLNANSELVWNKNWKRTGLRSVTLDGEAYFNVIKYNSQKFEVNTGDVIVKVLGTSFNVSKRRGETAVFLQEGKVELKLPGQKDLAMIPGDKIEYKSSIHKVEKSERETLHSAAAWKTGVINFHRQPLNKIIPALYDIYGIKLICMDDSLNHKIMDVGVPYMNWEATKQSLELAMNVVIYEKGGEYFIENKE